MFSFSRLGRSSGSFSGLMVLAVYNEKASAAILLRAIAGAADARGSRSVRAWGKSLILP